MSCELTEAQQKVLDSLDALSEGPMGLIELLPFPVPTTGAGIAEMAGVGAQYAEVVSALGSIEDTIKGAIPQIDLPVEIKGLQADISKFINEITPIVATATDVVLSVEDTLTEVDRLKTKWSGVDLGDFSIEDIPRLAKTGAADLQTLCKQLPNYTEEVDESGSINFILRGLPITFSSTDPIAALLGTPFPEILKPKSTIEVTRHTREAGERAVNLVIPGLFGTQ